MVPNKKTDEAIQKLSKFYKVISPKITVGTIKGKRRTVIQSMFKEKARFIV